MPNQKSNRVCPRCSARGLVWVCKLLNAERFKPVTWVCAQCESLIDRVELTRFRALEHREKISHQEKNTLWAH
jgi:hypothetical protein